MAGSYNKVILIGYLGRDPDSRSVPGGEVVTNFSVACTESWKDKNGQPQERTTWFNASTFGRLAETCSDYLHKGSYVYLEGALSQRDYTDRDGTQRQSLDVRVREMRMLDKAGSRASVENAPDASFTDQAGAALAGVAVPADVPF
jgi:single-strand DNA-binding protein